MNTRPKAYESSALPLSYPAVKDVYKRQSKYIALLNDHKVPSRDGRPIAAILESEVAGLEGEVTHRELLGEAVLGVGFFLERGQVVEQGSFLRLLLALGFRDSLSLIHS